MNMRIRISLIVLSFVWQVQAQSDSLRRIDSLTQALGKPMHDTVRVQTLIAMTEAYYAANPETAERFAFEAKCPDRCRTPLRAARPFPGR